MVIFDERDLYINIDYQRELDERINIAYNCKRKHILPQLFINGEHVGVSELCLLVTKKFAYIRAKQTIVNFFSILFYSVEIVSLHMYIYIYMCVDI